MERYRQVIETSKKKAIVDFNHNPSGTVPDQIPKLAEAGCLAFKIFMVKDTGRDYPHMPGIGVNNHGQLFRSFEAVAHARSVSALPGLLMSPLYYTSEAT